MNARPIAYNPDSAYAGMISISYDPSKNGAERIKFTTERLQFVPVENDEATVQFYDKELFGNKNVMGNFGNGFVHDYEAVTKKVHDLAKPWSKGEFGLAFTVRDKKTKELIGSTAFDKVRTNEYQFYVLVKENLADGTSAWNRGIGTEITYAMFQGWAVWLTGKPQEADGEAFECFNDWKAWEAPERLRMPTLLVKVEQANYAYRIISRMLKESELNKEKSKEITRNGFTQTVFYTTPDEMRSARRTIQIGEHMVCNGLSHSTPKHSLEDSFRMTQFLDVLSDVSHDRISEDEGQEKEPSLSFGTPDLERTPNRRVSDFHTGLSDFKFSDEPSFELPDLFLPSETSSLPYSLNSVDSTLDSIQLDRTLEKNGETS